jgi:hypothetical protein
MNRPAMFAAALLVPAALLLAACSSNDAPVAPSATETSDISAPVNGETVTPSQEEATVGVEGAVAVNEEELANMEIPENMPAPTSFIIGANGEKLPVFDAEDFVEPEAVNSALDDFKVEGFNNDPIVTDASRFLTNISQPNYGWGDVGLFTPEVQNKVTALLKAAPLPWAEEESSLRMLMVAPGSWGSSTGTSYEVTVDGKPVEGAGSKATWTKSGNTVTLKNIIFDGFQKRSTRVDFVFTPTEGGGMLLTDVVSAPAKVLK